ncbi:MAG: serine hydrolase domain-containing protein, partial [Candidatus Binatia bacterium]
MEIQGYADPRFFAVRRELERNFAERGEVGAAVAVFVDGHRAVDLWGGVADRRAGTPWRENTLQMVFSSTKGATALCAHVLAARGALDLDAPVARYWPEFAAGGKAEIPVRMLLNHQAGLAAIDEPLPVEAAYDWSVMTGALERQAPLWEPGTAHGYHAFTFGWLVGEVVRRVSGRSLGTFFHEEVARPLGLDFWIGLPEALEPRVARIIPAPLPEEASVFSQALATRGTLTSKAFLNPRTFFASGQTGSRAMHGAEIPGANGIATARGLAGMYATLACGGAWRAVELVDRDTLARMSAVESEGDDRVLLTRTRFAAGFMKTIDNPGGDCVRLGPNPEAFGHA